MQHTTSEWLNDRHALASGLIVEVDDPRHGRMRQMGNVAWLGDDKGALDKTPGPDANQHRAEILTALSVETSPPWWGRVGSGGRQRRTLTPLKAG